MKRLALALVLCPVIAAYADEAQLLERIERLEARIEQLERQLGGTTAEDRAVHSGMVATRYWLAHRSPFEGTSPEPEPLREGLMPLAPLIELEPSSYGIEEDGLFSTYRDPSRYPAAALAVEGTVQIQTAGDYRLIVKATPPREVGGAGNVKVQVTLSLGDKDISLPLSSSLAPREKVLRLPEGQLPLRFRILAQSPGFGPPPTGTQVFIGLQAPGMISPAPLRDFVVSEQR